MNELFRFENLLVYQKALDFSNEIFETTKIWPKEHTFSLTDQLRRASLSIVLNIAEGSSKTSADFKRYLGISRCSCHECIPIIEIGYKQGIIDKARKEAWREKVIVLSKMLSKLKSSLNSHN